MPLIRSFYEQNYHSNVKPSIRSVYHGTHPKNILNIIQNNLTCDKSKVPSATDDGWFGSGMYFSPHADYVMQYYSTGEFRRVKAGDTGKILQFDILPGRMLQMKDVKVGGPRAWYYDSHVSPNEFEYVMFDSRHILPRYVISFDVIPDPGKTFEGSLEQIGPQKPKNNQPKNTPPFYEAISSDKE